MLLSSLRSPRSGLYLLQTAFELPSPLDVSRFQAAWSKVAARYSALRTSFIVDRAEVQTKLHANPGVPWETSDLPLPSFFKSDRERGFDFSQGIPMRFTMLANTLVWTGHHALVDGPCYPVLWSEVFACYENPDCLLPARRPIPEIESTDPAAERYWRQYLTGIAATTDYIEERIRPGANEDAGESRAGFAEESFSLTDRETESLRTFAAQENLTMNTLLLGAWAQLLSRYSQRHDVVFGVTRSLRHSRDGVRRDGVGFFINTVPIRIQVAPGPGYLRQIRQQWIAGREHAAAPLERIQEWSGLPPGTPLFDSVLVYDHQPPTDSIRSLGGLAQFCTTGGVRRTESPLSVIVFGHPRLRVDILYDANRFSRETMAGVSGHFRSLLTSFGQEMLPPAEQDWLINGCNNTGAEFPVELRAHRLFEQQAACTPENTALEFDGGSLTYRQLNERADRVAALLPPADLIAVCMPRSPEAVIALLAVMKAGAAFLPVDPALPAGRIAAILEDARPSFVLRSGEALERLDLAHSDPPQHWANGHTAYVVYTSGTTGTPKGFAITHRSLVNHTLAVAAVFGIAAQDRRLQFAPMGTDVFIAEVFNYLSRGAALVMCPEHRGVAEFTRLLEERRITVTAFTGTWWTEWVAALADGSLQIPRSLRAVIVGMEQVNAAAFMTWRRLAGRVRWFNAYGPGETCPTTTIYEAGSSEYECGAYVPIGTPVANTRAYVLDASMNPVPIGVAGELYIGGEGVSSGYLNRPEWNAQKFLADPFRPGARIYRTGDLVFRLPDGFLVFVGRTDRQVKIRGFRIELEEIEAVLARHPAVRQCAVTAQRGETLVAYLSFHHGKEENLREHVARLLPAHMMPAAFVTLAALPLNAAGKIDYRSLPPYNPAQSPTDQSPAPPLTETAQRLSVLWTAILGTSAGNFFESGGDSLRATRLLVLIQREFGVELPMSVLFRAPTVPALAAYLETGAPVKPLRRAAGSRVPVFLISAAPDDAHRFAGLAENLDEDDQPFFALPSPLGPRDPLQTLEQIAQRVCRSVREAKPDGPYILGGYCFGGLVAVEVARQLKRAGADVRLVVLFDTPAPGYPKTLWNTGNYLRELRKGAEVGEALRHMARHLALLGRLLYKKIARRPEADSRAQAAARYSLQPVDFPMAQFLAADATFGTRFLDDSRLGWRDVCRAGFEVRRIAGDHLSLLLKELPPGLIEDLRELLRTANRVDVPPPKDLRNGASALSSLQSGAPSPAARTPVSKES